MASKTSLVKQIRQSRKDLVVAIWHIEGRYDFANWDDALPRINRAIQELNDIAEQLKVAQ